MPRKGVSRSSISAAPPSPSDLEFYPRQGAAAAPQHPPALRGDEVPPTPLASGQPAGLTSVSRCRGCLSAGAGNSPPLRATPRPGRRRLRRAGGGQGRWDLSRGSHLLCILPAHPGAQPHPPPLPWRLPAPASRHLGLLPPPPPRPRWLCLGGARRGPVARRPPARLSLAGRRACPCCPRRSSAACSISRW